MRDYRLRASLTKVLEEYSPDIKYVEYPKYFSVQHQRQIYHYYPEEGEWCNAHIKNPTYYPCRSIRKFIEKYVLGN
jgi:hypothetical protein